MKIQCDVCNKKEAIVFCSADEAALCHGCDHGVHHANKLASKHLRFSLLHPSPSLSPVCDICQEKRALLFCQEERAILCRDCDLPLHTVNEHTQKHNRFLLTGTKISALCNSDTSSGCDPVPEFESSRIPISQNSGSGSGSESNVMGGSVSDQLVSGGSSEDLVEMLPGWNFQDFEDASFGFKSENMIEFGIDGDVLSFWEVDIDRKISFSSSTNCSNQSENLGFWVPQAPNASVLGLNLQNSSGMKLNHEQMNQQEEKKTSVDDGSTFSRKWRSDHDVFTVPQITQSVVGSKRQRHF